MTYIQIDLDQMRIVHCHSNREALGLLGHIECQCATAILPAGSQRALSQFTVLELQRLYEQATGHKLLTYANHMARVVAEATMRMPETNVVIEELRAQAKRISMGDPRSFRYVLGSTHAEHTPDLFKPDPIKVERNVQLELATEYVTEPPPVARPRWEPTAADQAAIGAIVPASVPRAPRDPNAPAGEPRKGGTKEIVFQVADRMWEAAGRPVLPSSVLALRKEMMGELESAHQIKRTTSSNTLGEWQKTRIPII